MSSNVSYSFCTNVIFKDHLTKFEKHEGINLMINQNYIVRKKIQIILLEKFKVVNNWMNIHHQCNFALLGGQWKERRSM